MNTNKLYKCKYPDCTTEQKILSKGYCSYHRYLQKGSSIKRYFIKQETEKHKEKRQNKQLIMRPYWDFHLGQLRLGGRCDNCGCRIQGNICNIAHIIPKQSDFGIADIFANCLYLCASINGGSEVGCHERFDKTQGSAQVYNMNCWKLAVEKYLTFREKCRYNKYVETFEDYIKANEI